MFPSEHPWMQHKISGLRAQLPNLAYWRNAGWEPCDGPPPEPDLTREPGRAFEFTPAQATAEATARPSGHESKMTEE